MQSFCPNSRVNKHLQLVQNVAFKARRPAPGRYNQCMIVCSNAVAQTVYENWLACAKKPADRSCECERCGVVKGGSGVQDAHSSSGLWLMVPCLSERLKRRAGA